MFNSKKLKVPHKSFDNFYGLLVKEGERGVEKESTKVRNSIRKFRKFLKELENEISPLRNRRYYNGGFSTNLKISSNEGLQLSFIVNDAMNALSVCKDTIDNLNSEIDYKDGVIEGLEDENKELAEKYDNECKKLKQENQELQEEVLRLRYFYQVHSEGDQ